MVYLLVRCQYYRFVSYLLYFITVLLFNLVCCFRDKYCDPRLSSSYKHVQVSTEPLLVVPLPTPPREARRVVQGRTPSKKGINRLHRANRSTPAPTCNLPDTYPTYFTARTSRRVTCCLRRKRTDFQWIFSCVYVYIRMFWIRWCS